VKEDQVSEQKILRPVQALSLFGLDDLVFVFWQWLGIFLFTPCIQASSGAYPASYLMGTRGSFPGGKTATA
jgi:hypothetical protein